MNIFGFETTFSVDEESRTIAGLAVPYGAVAKKGGRKYSFSKGTLAWREVSRVKLLLQHDRSQAVGRALELNDSDTGLFVKFKIARTPEGDRALALAADGVYDGLSIGLGDDAQFDNRDGVNHATGSNMLAEISLTPNPAFDDARVSAVAAEADDERINVMPEEAAAAPQFDLDALATALAEKMKVDGPGFVPTVPAIPGNTQTVQVTEAAPYRFNDKGLLTKGTHEFADDLRSAAYNHDKGAEDRALAFISEQLAPDSRPAEVEKSEGVQFAVSTTNVAGLNPNIQRPDLYVDQRKFQYPLWDAVRKGVLNEITPIVLPKWSSHSGLVAAHSEGVEPTPGAFAVTTETVTPAAVSGKVEINREVWDQGGPVATQLIWSKMQQSWFEALEAIVVTELDAESPGTTTTLTTAAVDAALSGEIAAAFAGFQYTRGGFAYDVLAVQIDLYKKLVAAKDTAGRPLFPIINPVNAPGSAARRYGTLDVHGVTAFPAWGLAATGVIAANSYLFDSSAVYAVASAPQRLEFQSLVKQVELAIWGYRVCEVIDNPGVVRVVYDPV